jgi:predicted Holliday junction resolvase-like endonuclease
LPIAIANPTSFVRIRVGLFFQSCSKISALQTEFESQQQELERLIQQERQQEETLQQDRRLRSQLRGAEIQNNQAVE